MTEYVEIQCAACHHEFVVKSKAVGQKCKCPDCGQMSDVSENLPLRKKPGWGTLLVASLARFRLAGAMLLLAALGVALAAFAGAGAAELASMKSSTSGRMLLRQLRPAKMP